MDGRGDEVSGNGRREEREEEAEVNGSGGWLIYLAGVPTGSFGLSGWSVCLLGARPVSRTQSRADRPPEVEPLEPGD